VFVCKVSNFSAEYKAIGVTFCTAVHRRPKQWISDFGKLCSPEAQNRTNQRSRGPASGITSQRRGRRIGIHTLPIGMYRLLFVFLCVFVQVSSTSNFVPPLPIVVPHTLRKIIIMPRWLCVFAWFIVELFLVGLSVPTGFLLVWSCKLALPTFEDDNEEKSSTNIIHLC